MKRLQMVLLGVSIFAVAAFGLNESTILFHKAVAARLTLNHLLLAIYAILGISSVYIIILKLRSRKAKVTPKPAHNGSVNHVKVKNRVNRISFWKAIRPALLVFSGLIAFETAIIAIPHLSDSITSKSKFWTTAETLEQLQKQKEREKSFPSY